MDSAKSELRGRANSIGYHHHHRGEKGARPKCIAPLFLLRPSFGTPLPAYSCSFNYRDEREGAKRAERSGIELCVVCWR